MDKELDIISLSMMEREITKSALNFFLDGDFDVLSPQAKQFNDALAINALSKLEGETVFSLNDIKVMSIALTLFEEYYREDVRVNPLENKLQTESKVILPMLERLNSMFDGIIRPLLPDPEE